MTFRKASAISDSTPIAPPIRRLKSPFNGELWPVPPEVTPELYAELVKRGFEPVDDSEPRRDRGR